MKTNINPIDLLIFRTSIKDEEDVKYLADILDNYPQITQWNIDLEDWEKVLRIECNGITATEIADALRTADIWAIELL